MPKVSVIMPVYNGEKYIKQSLDSILEQEVDLELVVIDDGSTDNSPEILKSIEDPRMKVIKQKNSGNPAGPRNRGLQEARGSYVAFCDQDDIWYKDKLKKQLTALEEATDAKNIGIVVTSAEIINDDGKRVGKNKLKDEYIPQNEAFERLIKANFITACSSLVPIKIFEWIDVFDESLTGVDDYDLWLRITQKYDVLSLEEILRAWRQSDEALSADKVRLYEENERIFEKPEKAQKSKSVKIGHGKNLMRIIVAAIIKKDYQKADVYIQKAKDYPISENGQKIISLFSKNHRLGRISVMALKTAGKVKAMKAKILNVEIDCLRKPELETLIGESLNGDKVVKIGKVNTEFLLRAHNSEEFAKSLDQFEIKIADGSGVLWAAKYLSLPLTKKPAFRALQAWWQAKYTLFMLAFKPEYCIEPIPERFPGVEAFYLMIEAAEKTKSPVYFLGAQKEVLEKAVKVVKQKYPNLEIVGWHDGYNFNDNEVIADINEKKPKFLVVALGSPKQEYWIRDHISELPSVRVAVGEGGSFDFISGEHKRAPEWMRKSGLEWFWRMFMNKDKTGSSRLSRVWQAVPVFVSTIVSYKIKTTVDSK